MKISPLLVICFAGLAAPVWAGTAEPEPGSATRYEEADVDRDGRISREEFLAGVRNKRGWWAAGAERANTGQNSATPAMFEALDRDRDGFLTAEELEAGRRLRESRGDNSFGASGSRSNRPAPVSKPASPAKEKPEHPAPDK
jgi:hypothetical protein